MRDADLVQSLRRELGDEVRRRRDDLRLTQEAVAARVSCARESITQVERGRQDTSRELMARIDQALEADGALLAMHRELTELRRAARTAARSSSSEAEASEVDRRQFLQRAGALTAAAIAPSLHSPSAAGLQATAEAIRAAVFRYEGIPGLQHRPASAAPALPVLASTADGLWVAFQESRYSALALQLPDVLAGAQLVAGDGARNDQEQQLAARLLSETYQVAAFALTKLGDANAAWMTAERAMTTAARSEDLATLGAASRVLSYALGAAGRAPEAERIGIGAAEALEPGLGKASADYLSVYGSLMLKGAMAAAQAGRDRYAEDLLDEAEATARRVGEGCNHRHTAFGPSNVMAHRVAAAVDLGHGGRAVALAQQVRAAHLPAKERYAHLLIDAARGYGQWKKPAPALDTLLAAERLAPEEVQGQPKVRDLVRDLLEHQPRRDNRLRALAHRVGAWA
jgi:transcriptional regulator with XRE-family HTH domain